MSSTRKPRGPYRKGQERREQILDAAYDIFAEHGDNAASLQEIADRVGVKHPSLLHYFGSREELLLAVLERRDRLGTAAAGKRPPTEAIAEAARHTMANPGLARLYVALSASSVDPNTLAHAFFRDRSERIAARLANEMAAHQKDGTVRTDESPEHMARLLVAVLDGLQTQWLNTPSVDMSALVETFLRMCAAHADAAPQESD